LHYGLSEILSEDFTRGRRYGSVQIANPFVEGTPAPVARRPECTPGRRFHLSVAAYRRPAR
jgi:hypothetical protein